MNYFNQTKEEVIKSLGSSYDGLSTKEAILRLETNGRNKLIESKKASVIQRFLKQLIEPMTIILIIAAAI